MKVDYELLAAVLGKHWPFITPDYFYYEMDDWELNRYISLLPYEDAARVFGLRPRQTKGVRDLVRDGVIRKH